VEWGAEPRKRLETICFADMAKEKESFLFHGLPIGALCDELRLSYLTVDRGAFSISASRHPGSSLGAGFGL
jgi:hypothetical protein